MTRNWFSPKLAWYLLVKCFGETLNLVTHQANPKHLITLLMTDPSTIVSMMLAKTYIIIGIDNLYIWVSQLEKNWERWPIYVVLQTSNEHHLKWRQECISLWQRCSEAQYWRGMWHQSGTSTQSQLLYFIVHQTHGHCFLKLLSNWYCLELKTNLPALS